MTTKNTRSTTKSLLATGLAVGLVVTVASTPAAASEPWPLYQEPAAGAPGNGYGYRQTAWAPERADTVVGGTVIDRLGDFLDDVFNVRNIEADRVIDRSPSSDAVLAAMRRYNETEIAGR